MILAFRGECFNACGLSRPPFLSGGSERRKYKQEDNPGADDICSRTVNVFLLPQPLWHPLKLVEFIAEVGSWLLPVPGLTTVMATLLLSYRLQALSPWRVISFLEERYL